MLQLKDQLNIPVNDRTEIFEAPSKPCPNCTRLNDYEARICSCGHWFVEQAIFQQETELQQVRQEKSQRKRSKFVIISSFIVLVLTISAYFGGFLDFGSRSRQNPETVSSANEVRTLESQAPPNTARTAKNTLNGQVISVADGGIVIIRTGGQEYKVKLIGVEMPRADIGFGQQYKDKLASILVNKEVTVIQQKIEDGGLILGKMVVGDRNINLELVKNGLAKFDRNSLDYQSDDDITLFSEAEANAQKAQLGVWSPAFTGLLADTSLNSGATTTSKPVAGNGQQPALPTDIYRTSNPRSRQLNMSPAETVSNDAITPPTVKSETTTRLLTNPSPPVMTDRSPEPVVAVGNPCPSGNCSNQNSVPAASNTSTKPAAPAAEKKYFLGPRGGCYKINSSGNKTYVDKSLCS